MRALVHVHFRPQHDKENISPTTAMLAVLSQLKQWNVHANGDDARVREEIHSQTYVLLSRIPARDRDLAIATYVSTLYHGPTKSWCLVSIPNTEVADFRVFNPDSEALKTACSCLVRDLQTIAADQIPLSSFETDSAFRKIVHSQHGVIERLIAIRSEYEYERDSIAARPNASAFQFSPYRREAVRLVRRSRQKRSARNAHPLTESRGTAGESSTAENPAPCDSLTPPASTTPDDSKERSPYTVSFSFPSKITILQPDAPELAFEGEVITGTKLRYSFRKQKPTSVVSLLAFGIGLLFIFLPWTDGSRMGRVDTAFIATGVFGIASLLTSWLDLLRYKRGATIDWQDL